MLVVATLVSGCGKLAYYTAGLFYQDRSAPNSGSLRAPWPAVPSSAPRPSAKTPRVMATPLLAIGQTGPNYFVLYLGAVVLAVLGALAVLPIKNVR
jgi:hypothetical protein